MLYVFHGTDIQASVRKSHTLVDSLRTKKPDATFVRVEADMWSPSVIEEHIGGQGLFSNKYIILLDRVTENAEAKEQIVDVIPVLHESSNIFIVLEGKLNAELKKAFEKHSDKVVTTDEPAVSKWRPEGRAGEGHDKDEFNIFSLADAIGERNSFKAWSIYRQAIDAGLEVESIVGTLFWQVKSMTLASSSKSAGESGLSPFVYSKAKKGSGNYSPEELSSFMNDLISIYHDSHRGLVDGELEIERRMLCLK